MHILLLLLSEFILILHSEAKLVATPNQKTEHLECIAFGIM